MRTQAFYRAAAVFLVYLFPVLVGTAAMLRFSLKRSAEAVHEVCHHVCGKARSASVGMKLPENASPLEKRLAQILDSGNRLSPLRSLAEDCCLGDRPHRPSAATGSPAPDAGVANAGQPVAPPSAKDGDGHDRHHRHAGHDDCLPRIRSSWTPPNGWLTNAIFIVCLTLFPFATFGSRIAANAFDKPGAASDMLRCASGVFLNKLIISAAIACGWLFVFNPLGIATSSVDTFVTDHEVLTSNSLPYLLQSSYSLRPMLAAFFGWYLHFTAYAFYRARRNDVRSPRFLGVLFRKLLLALALGSILSIDAHSGGPTGLPEAPSFGPSAVAFLFGFLPASAIAFLKDQGTRLAGGIRAASGTLSDLSALSTWEVVRLEEEGIDSLASLLVTRRKSLHGLLPESAEKVVDLWYEQAALMVAVGAERYARLSNVCQTATHFVANSADPAFQAKLKAAAAIENPAELATILREKFGRGTPADLALGDG